MADLRVGSESGSGAAVCSSPPLTGCDARGLSRERTLSRGRSKTRPGSSQPNGRLGFQVELDFCDLSLPKIPVHSIVWSQYSGTIDITRNHIGIKLNVLNAPIEACGQANRSS